MVMSRNAIEGVQLRWMPAAANLQPAGEADQEDASPHIWHELRKMLTCPLGWDRQITGTLARMNINCATSKRASEDHVGNQRRQPDLRERVGVPIDQQNLRSPTNKYR